MAELVNKKTPHVAFLCLQLSYQSCAGEQQ